MPPSIRRQVPGVPSRKPAGGVLERIKPIGFDPNEGIKVALYGLSGTGKTTIWATFPAPILAIICSGGLKPGELRSVDTPANRSRISSVVLEKSEEMKDIIGHAAGGAFKTIVLDHVTGLQDLTLKEILGLDEIPVQKGWGTAHQQQYGQSTTQCKEYLRAMLNLDCNVVVIGQERTFGGAEDGMDGIKPTVGIAVTPSLAGWLNPACDYVLQTFKRQKMVPTQTTVNGKVTTEMVPGKGIEYCVRLEPHATYMTKFRRADRTKPLPDVLVDATYDKLIKLIRA